MEIELKTNVCTHYSFDTRITQNTTMNNRSRLLIHQSMLLPKQMLRSSELCFQLKRLNLLHNSFSKSLFAKLKVRAH